MFIGWYTENTIIMNPQQQNDSLDRQATARQKAWIKEIEKFESLEKQYTDEDLLTAWYHGYQARVQVEKEYLSQEGEGEEEEEQEEDVKEEEGQ